MIQFFNISPQLLKNVSFRSINIYKFSVGNFRSIFSTLGVFNRLARRLNSAASGGPFSEDFPNPLWRPPHKPHTVWPILYTFRLEQTDILHTLLWALKGGVMKHFWAFECVITKTILTLRCYFVHWGILVDISQNCWIKFIKFMLLWFHNMNSSFCTPTISRPRN